MYWKTLRLEKKAYDLSSYSYLHRNPCNEFWGKRDGRHTFLKLYELDFYESALILSLPGKGLMLSWIKAKQSNWSCS